MAIGNLMNGMTKKEYIKAIKVNCALYFFAFFTVFLLTVLKVVDINALVDFTSSKFGRPVFLAFMLGIFSYLFLSLIFALCVDPIAYPKLVYFGYFSICLFLYFLMGFICGWFFKISFDASVISPVSITGTFEGLLFASGFSLFFGLIACIFGLVLSFLNNKGLNVTRLNILKTPWFIALFLVCIPLIVLNYSFGVIPIGAYIGMKLQENNVLTIIECALQRDFSKYNARLWATCIMALSISPDATSYFENLPPTRSFPFISSRIRTILLVVFIGIWFCIFLILLIP